ncbi:DedA family protein [Streptomonospora salina]|uniref:Membrane protein DedA with SNARE-associated domain n=1 Tax=Streptomonospora salina TaxID=104205 RepID=A0A841E4S7_9ACTN|nr:VTT domain-containing protein [Streptomonospora salina]MBB5997454.1 membrane protein DedA with SNARE-associated domain [Streptomonospora salina]
MDYGFLDGRPFWIVYAALFAIAFARTQTIYWIGRGVGAGLHRSRTADRIGDRLTRAERMINRFGPPVVTASYATVGVQSAIHLAAGAMRMSYWRYLAAMLPGCAGWAAIYSFGGLAVIAVWWELFLRSPFLAAAAVVLAAATAASSAALVRRRRRRSPAAGADAADAPGNSAPAPTAPDASA